MNQGNLAEYLRKKMAEEKLSTYDIARASGDRINANTITRILNGDIKEAKLSTLEAIASALGITVDEIVRIDRGLSPRPSRFEMYAETFGGTELTEADWRILEIYFQGQVNQWKALKYAAENSPPITKSKARKKST